MGPTTDENVPSPTTEELLRHTTWLKRFVRALTEDGHEAEDVLQETWIQARGSLGPAGVSPRAWLAGIAKNVTRARRRRELHAKERERRARPLDRAPDAASELLAMERQRELIAEVEALTAVQRRAIFLRFYEELPPREIAAREGIAVSTVHTRIQRGLESLRRSLDGKYGDRRSWAAWCVPLITPHRVAARSTVIGTWSLGMVAVAVAVTLASMWFGSSSGPVDHGDEGPASATESLELAGAPEREDSLVAEPPPTRPMSPRKAPSVPPLRLSLVTAPEGEPAAGAEVYVLGSAALAELLEGVQPLGMESLLLNEGRFHRADEEGIATVGAEPPFVALARTDGHIGLLGVARRDSPSTIALTAAHALTCSVVSAAGRPIPSSLRIGGSATIRLDSDAHDHDDLRVLESRKLRGRLAVFQNPWIGANIELTDTFAPEDMVIDTVYINAPGFFEFEETARARTAFRPFAAHGAPREVSLFLPEHGALDIIVAGADGRPAKVAGRVALRFPGVGHEEGAPQRYRTPLVDGRARFDLFAVGSRLFEVEISIPSRGTSWVTTGAGPPSHGTTTTLSTRLPEGPAISARLIDSTGRAVAGAAVALNHARPKRANWIESIRGESTSDGSVRFALPEKGGAAAPFGLVAHRKSDSGGLEEAFHRIELSDSELARGHDLGDIVLSFVPPTRIRGRVVSDDGTPVPNAHVTFSRAGQIGRGAACDTDGGYEIALAVHGPLEASVYDPADRHVAIKRRIEMDRLNEPLDFELPRGATMIADIDFGELDIEGDMIKIMLVDRRPTPEGGRDWAELTHRGGGHFAGTTIPPGTYDAGLRLRGNHDLAIVEGIRIPDSGTVRDARLDGLRVTDHVREVEVSWSGAPATRTPQMHVIAHGSGERRDLHLTYVGEPFLVPTRIAASAVLTSGTGSTVRIEDTRTVGDELVIAFERPVTVELMLIGHPIQGTRYTLRGEPSTAAEGAVVTLDFGGRAGTALRPRFPVSGPYRLHHEPAAVELEGGIVAVSSPVPTVATLEVLEPGADRPIQKSVLRIDSPDR